MAWHLHGAAGTPTAWMRMSSFDRSVIADEVQRRIDEHNEQIGE